MSFHTYELAPTNAYDEVSSASSYRLDRQRTKGWPSSSNCVPFVVTKPGGTLRFAVGLVAAPDATAARANADNSVEESIVADASTCWVRALHIPLIAMVVVVSVARENIGDGQLDLPSIRRSVAERPTGKKHTFRPLASMSHYRCSAWHANGLAPTGSCVLAEQSAAPESLMRFQSQQHPIE